MKRKSANPTDSRRSEGLARQPSLDGGTWKPFRLLASCLVLLTLSGCGKSSVSGVYECKGKVETRTRDFVVLTRTFTYDFRSDGSFVWTYDPGQDTEGRTDSNRQVTQGKWEYQGGRIVCYNGDGMVFGELKREGGDLITKEGARYRRQ